MSSTLISTVAHQLIKIAKNSKMTSMHGAAILYGKTVIAKGCNHPCVKEAKGCLSIHAEENVIGKFSRAFDFGKNRFYDGRARYGKLHMVVIRIDANGNYTSSKPCKNCIELLQKFNIRKVTYSTKNGELITESIENVCDTKLTSGYRSIERMKSAKISLNTEFQRLRLKNYK